MRKEVAVTMIQTEQIMTCIRWIVSYRLTCILRVDYSSDVHICCRTSESARSHDAL